MREQFYQPNTANYPRLKTDTFFVDESNRYQYTGFVEGAIRFIDEFQLLRPDLWKLK